MFFLVQNTSHCANIEGVETIDRYSRWLISFVEPLLNVQTPTTIMARHKSLLPQFTVGIFVQMDSIQIRNIAE